MSSYANFMKNFVIRKKMVNFEPSDNVHHCSVIASRSLVEKKEDTKHFLFYVLLVHSTSLELCVIFDVVLV